MNWLLWSTLVGISGLVLIFNDLGHLWLVVAGKQASELIEGQVHMFSGGSMLDQLVPTVVSHFAPFHGAGVGLLPNMPSLVVVFVSTRWKLLWADLALIWFLTGVHSHVNLLKCLEDKNYLLTIRFPRSLKDLQHLWVVLGSFQVHGYFLFVSGFGLD